MAEEGEPALIQAFSAGEKESFAAPLKISG
jgi:hypothetical protein